MNFAEMMTLEPSGSNTFTGECPIYQWGAVYGGQVVAQALRAAGATVADRYEAHSLHAYYIRRGDCNRPIDFQVTPVRDGRSFATRSVVASQEQGAILTMTASFQAGEPAVDKQTAKMPQVPPPEELTPGGWGPSFDRRFAPVLSPGRVQAWMTLNEEVGDDPMLQACALAYLSDDVPTDAMLALLHPDRPPVNDYQGIDPSLWTSSLDHTIWFHRPIHAGGWQLHDFACRSLINSRGLSLGQVFNAAGTHLATVSQEILVRPARPGAWPGIGDS